MVAQLSGPGLPDLIVGYAGRISLLECKTGRSKRTPAQEQFHALWAQYPVHVVRTPEQALAAVGVG